MFNSKLLHGQSVSNDTDTILYFDIDIIKYNDDDSDQFSSIKDVLNAVKYFWSIN